MTPNGSQELLLVRFQILPVTGIVLGSIEALCVTASPGARCWDDLTVPSARDCLRPTLRLPGLRYKGSLSSATASVYDDRLGYQPDDGRVMTIGEMHECRPSLELISMRLEEIRRVDGPTDDTGVFLGRVALCMYLDGIVVAGIATLCTTWVEQPLLFVPVDELGRAAEAINEKLDLVQGMCDRRSLSLAA